MQKGYPILGRLQGRTYTCHRQTTIHPKAPSVIRSGLRIASPFSNVAVTLKQDMDIRRPSAPAVRVPSYRENAATSRSTFRSDSRTSDDCFGPREAMPIPGTHCDEAPPPLPPPRYNEELAQGIDVAWSWANSDPFNNTARRLAPIKPNSSLYGGDLHLRRSSGRSRDDEMDLDEDYPRKGSDVSTVKSATRTAAPIAGPIPTLTREPASPSMASQRLVD